MDLVREVWAYLKARKRFWLLPLLLILAAVGALLILGETSAVAPFIYTLF